MKRSDYLRWGDYFMGIALLTAQRSKDPNTQVGSCIVDKKNHIVGTGYNGFPNGCSDDEFPWSNKEEYLNTKYPFVCHSEMNSIINSSGDLSGATIYVTLFPCNECAKFIIQSGIRSVEYLSDKYHDENFSIAARKMFDAAGVSYHCYQPLVKHIDINLEIKEQIFTEEKND